MNKYSVVEEFTEVYKEQASCYVDVLFSIAKLGDSEAENRVERVGAMTEAYYEHADRHADSNVLERLASLILYGELTDSHPDKMTREEYPILSEDQQERRTGNEYNVSDMQYGLDTTVGYRKVVFEDENGVAQVRRKRIYEFPR